MIELDGGQLTAVEQLKNGKILCGGVGSGKSLTSLAWYYRMEGGKFKIREDDGKRYASMPDLLVQPSDLYIITTAKKRDSKDWERELSNICMAPGDDIYQNKVTIDSWNNIGKYVNVRNAYFIFDEQRIVGSGAWVKAFYKIAAQNLWILLSATPGDKWEDYIPVFVANHYYRNKTDFIHRHVIYKFGMNFPVVDRYWDEQKLTALRDSLLINLDYLRPTTRHHFYAITSYDRLLYKRTGAERKNPETGLPILNVSEFCQCLRKICNADPSRAEAVLYVTLQNPRCIIFYNYNYELEILKKMPYAPGTVVAQWNGKVHQQVPNSERWVYLVQYNAGAEGWECITTDSMIFYSDNYSYRMMEQACGRIDRRNTTYTDLNYYHFRTTSNIDLAMKRTLEKKKNFNEGAFVRKWTQRRV